MKILTATFFVTVLGAALADQSVIPETAVSRFEFREPDYVVYRVETAARAAGLTSVEDSVWLRAWPEGSSTNATWLGRRVVLQVESPDALERVLAATGLPVARVVTSNLVVLEASSARMAVAEASRLARHAEVTVCHPVRRRAVKLHGPYAPRPNDTLFGYQWHLENRDANTAAVLGPDLNARSAWADNQGEGVLVATGDNGVEVSHPDLAANMTNRVHRNFITARDDGNPVATTQVHGTAVGGLIAARGNNARGVAGVAPRAQLASWVIFDRFDGLADEETVMDMFHYQSNIVSVQNHSWGNADVGLLRLSALEDQGIANAVERGRQGRGVVIVRSAGNARMSLSDLNDDGFGQDPRAISVGAVRANGRAASYSTPGAPVLVGAFSGDEGVNTPNGLVTNYLAVATTDRQGSLGYNSSGPAPDYGFQSTGFGGTSASSPQIAGLCALILAANPALTYRDVQQVLILSSRQLDPSDPDLRINGAGLSVSHNVGFGVPDAGLAVELARAWTNRPARIRTTAAFRQSIEIPDDGLRVVIGGSDVPTELQSIPAWPSDGLHPDAPTEVTTLVDVGQALAPLAVDLTNQAALIKRGVNYFADKIAKAAAAGARFAIVYNNADANQRVFMAGADIHFQTIPAVFIDQTRGEALQAYLAAHPETTAQLRLDAVRCPVTISESLLCEHVKLRASFSHPRRADVRVTLLSPAGTRSVLHRFNNDTASALSEWTFNSTQHFYESSAGVWQIEVSDQNAGSTGRVVSLDLTVYGVRIEDVDRDGLDDQWELARFGSLDQGPAGDPDQDGWSNVREQILGRDPAIADRPFRLDLSRWDSRWGRLSWPAGAAFRYEVSMQSALGEPPQVVSEQTGRFPELDLIVPLTDGCRFYQVRQVQRDSPDFSPPGR
ncbi:MAG TPA: S8 family serine peptidase [Candidatus Paceibacterota bacterium]|nr:S8 family serine peptidase [Candidatus Paceibacterota bacterium]